MARLFLADRRFARVVALVGTLRYTVVRSFAHTALFGLLAFGLGLPRPLYGQQFTISGVVIERTDLAPVGNAVVRLAGVTSQITNNDGRFRFSGVTAGNHTLSIEAFGYGEYSLELVVHADTILEIGLDPNPFPLDTVVVSTRRLTISGGIYDAATGLKLLQGAQVTVYPGSRVIDAVSGGFTLRNVPSGSRIGLLVEALEYLPATLEFVVQNDTTVTVALDVDSVGMRLVAQQVVRLENRSMSIPHPIRAVNRDRIRQSGTSTIGELIHRLRPGSTFDRRAVEPFEQCVLLDDMRVGLEDVVNIPPELIERVEVLGRRGSMVRVYTRRYVARLMRIPTLPVIIFSEHGRRACW